MTRRELMSAMALPLLGFGNAGAKAESRHYHLSLSCDAIEADPDLLDVVQRSGVSDVWLGGFLYGHWYYTLERLQVNLERIPPI